MGTPGEPFPEVADPAEPDLGRSDGEIELGGCWPDFESALCTFCGVIWVCLTLLEVDADDAILLLGVTLVVVLDGKDLEGDGALTRACGDLVARGVCLAAGVSVLLFTVWDVVVIGGSGSSVRSIISGSAEAAETLLDSTTVEDFPVSGGLDELVEDSDGFDDEPVAGSLCISDDLADLVPGGSFMASLDACLVLIALVDCEGGLEVSVLVGGLEVLLCGY